MQTETKSRVDQLNTHAGHPVTVLRFEGDIASTSKEAVLGVYQGLPKDTAKLILLDFTKVDYINSSGGRIFTPLWCALSATGTVYSGSLSSRITRRT